MSTATPTPTKTVPEKVLEVIGYGNAAVEAAATKIAAVDAEQEKVAALVEQAVEAMVSGERILDNAEQRAKVAEILKSPSQTVELLTRVATHRNTSETSLGQPVDPGRVKQGAAGNGRQSYDSLTDPRPGMRTTLIKQSDARLFSGLGLNQPSQD